MAQAFINIDTKKTSHIIDACIHSTTSEWSPVAVTELGETSAEAKLCCRCHFTLDQRSFVDVIYQRQSGCRACFLSGLCTQRCPRTAATGCCQCCWYSVCLYCPRQCSGIQSPGGTGVRNCDYTPLEGWLLMSSSFSGLRPISESCHPDITYTDWLGIKMLSHTDCRQWKLWMKCKLE